MILCSILFFLSIISSIIGAFKIGQMKGFREGMDEADRLMDEQILLRWNKLKDENK